MINAREVINGREVINSREVINMGGISELNVDVRQIVRGNKLWLYLLDK